MKNIIKLKNDIINATGDIEVFGEPTDILESVAKQNNVSFNKVQKLYYKLLEGEA